MIDLDTDLPTGWTHATLGDVVEISKEKIEPQATGKSAYLSLEHIEAHSGRILARGSAEEVTSTKAVFRSGDVLYGKLRPYLNKVCVPDFDGVCSTDILVFRESSALSNRFLARFLSQRSVVEFATQNSQGINLPRVSAATLSELELDLPPIEEQKRIAEKIDALQDRSRSAREALEAVGPLLEQFRQSVLAAAFRGDLTADWRAAHPDTEPASALLARIRQERRHKWEQAELAKMKAKGKTPADDKWKERYEEPAPVVDSDLPELPERWCWVSVDEVCWSLRSGTAETSGREITPFPVLKSSSVRPGVIDFSDINYLRAEQSQVEENYLQDGDLLITRLSGSLDYVGNCAVVRGLGRRRLQYPDRLFCASVTESANKQLIEFAFSCKSLRVGLEQAAKSSAGHQRISMSDVRRFCFPLAGREEQKQILARITHALKSISVVSAELEPLLNETRRLDDAILAKAFRGELVPQDANDEPASVLLERIRAALSISNNGMNGKGNGSMRRQRRGGITTE